MSIFCPSQWSAASGSLELTSIRGNPDKKSFQKLGVHVEEDFIIVSDSIGADVQRLPLGKAIAGNSTLSTVHGFTSAEVNNVKESVD